MYFIDSNIIVYANDLRDPEKQAKALSIIEQSFLSAEGVLSVQVLQEYANTALYKLHQDRGVVLNQIALLSQMKMVEPDSALVARAVELTGLFPLSFWDASIIAAAERAGCRRLLSEDLNPGQSYGMVEVNNPFVD
ncbi:MAG: PIN domain-containing protein [Opitutales bacterium]